MGYGWHSALPHRHRRSAEKNGGIPSVPACTSGCGRISRTAGSGYAGQCALDSYAAQSLMTRLQDELRMESVRAQAREQFTGAVDRIFDSSGERLCLGSVARTVPCRP